MSRPLKVFLCYAREDTGRVEILYKNLAAAGFQPWMDRSDIPEGAEWHKHIQSAIVTADVFLACISRDSVKKAGVLKSEIDTALRLWRRRWWRRLKLVPVRLDQTPPFDELGHLQWFDLLTDDRWRELAPRIRQAQRRYMALKWAAAMLVVVGAVLAGWRVMDSSQRWPEGPQRFGVTLWRLRESSPEDEVRIPIEPSVRNGLKRTTEFTPVRIGLDQPVPAGSMVQISVESAQDGHLYIVDQELSSTPGRACLVFPDPRIRAGATRVRAGDVIHLPYLDESVRPYWLLGSTDPDYRGELLTIVMSPRPLEFAAIPGPCREVPTEEFSRWQKQWAAAHTLDPDPSSVGRPVSRVELDAGRGSKALTLDDPRPQVILSMAGRSPKAPVLIWFKVAVTR